MPQNRQNADRTLTPAEKQAAYRARQESKADRLTGLLYRLEAATWGAADRGDALAQAVKGSSIEGMIENLIAPFEAAGEPERADGEQAECRNRKRAGGL